MYYLPIYVRSYLGTIHKPPCEAYVLYLLNKTPTIESQLALLMYLPTYVSLTSKLLKTRTIRENRDGKNTKGLIGSSLFLRIVTGVPVGGLGRLGMWRAPRTQEEKLLM